ncbi:hypothetical protein B0H13DRAFT_2261010 [Mycena leptocephala]|nr:hypothetical protein B0H13DRAFT_2261010 [Mycena leptocephala]
MSLLLEGGTETAGDNAAVIGGRDQAVGPLALEAPHLGQRDCEVVFLQFKSAQLAVDSEWLEALVRFWPNPCPTPDHAEVVWNFARHFMAWRDSVIAETRNMPVITAEDTLNSLSQQMACIVSLEKLCREWKSDALDVWQARNKPDQGFTVNSLQEAIDANVTKIMFREARMIYILHVLVSAWRNHIRNGLSPLSAGSESYSDLRILQECRVTIDQAQSFEEALEAPKVDTQRYVSFRDPADVSARSDSDHLQSPSPGINPPRARRPDFATRMEAAIPSTVFQTRRKLIQNEWNKIAREAGAAGIEFYNDVDEEEVPPGVGVLFPYVERSYLLVSDLFEQGLFTFNTESEIVECSNLCGCPRECPNRVAQFPRQIHVQIFKTRKRGWGARVPVDLIKGQVVGLYTGRRDQANKLSGSRASYCFDLDANEDPNEDLPEHAYSVDAYGCVDRELDSVFKDNMPYLAFVAKEDIPAYMELTFDYNPADQAEWEAQKYKQKSKSKINKIKKGATACLCGAAQCRGLLSVIA